MNVDVDKVLKVIFIISLVVGVLALIVGVLSTQSKASAINVSPYASIDDSNSVCNLLIDYYKNMSDYDPFADYAVVRTGQYTYQLFYGDFENNPKYIKYDYSSSGYGSSYSISTGSVSNVTISPGDYNFVGNIEGSSASALAEDYKKGFIVVAVVLLIAVLLLWRVIHRHRASTAVSSGFTMR